MSKHEYPQVTVTKEQAERLQVTEFLLNAGKNRIKCLEQKRETLTSRSENVTNTKMRKQDEAVMEELKAKRDAIKEVCGASTPIDPQRIVIEPVLELLQGWKDRYQEALDKFKAGITTFNAESTIQWQAASLVGAEELYRWAAETEQNIEHFQEEGMLPEKAIYQALCQMRKAGTRQVMQFARNNASSSNPIANEIRRAKNAALAEQLDEWGMIAQYIREIERFAADMAAYRLVEEDEQV